MFNLKKLLQRNKALIDLPKEDIALLEYFISHKDDFESWFASQQTTYPKIKFTFYYPTAIDFTYDEFKLFTVYFNKSGNDAISLSQFKISQVNGENIKTKNWKPFKEVMLQYIAVVEKQNTDLLFLKMRSLHEYQQLCKEGNGLSKVQDNAQQEFSPFIIPESTLQY